MELRAQTAKLWQNFEAKGTLGEGAKRENLSMMQSMETVAYELAADMMHRYDNSEVDQDPRAGFTKFRKADFEAKAEGELSAQMPGLMDGGKMDADTVADMVAMGMMTKEEGEQMLQDVNSTPTVKNAVSEGEVSKSADGTIFTVQTTTGDENDVEYIRSGADGMRFLHVEPNGDGFKAHAIFTRGGEGYKETLEGGWNLIN